MMNRANQEWPQDETVEIPEEAEPATGTLIEGLISTVEKTEKVNDEKTKRCA